MENNRKLRDTGYLYDPNTAEFVEERARVKDLCFEYNNLTRPSDVKRQHEMLDKILGKHGVPIQKLLKSTLGANKGRCNSHVSRFHPYAYA